jgi:hypothetical protein
LARRKWKRKKVRAEMKRILQMDISKGAEEQKGNISQRQKNC